MSPSAVAFAPSLASSASVRTADFSASRARSASGRATSVSVLRSISFTRRSCSPIARSAAAAARCTFGSLRSSSARSVLTPSSSRTFIWYASRSCTSFASASAARRARSCDAAACASAYRRESALIPEEAGGGGLFMMRTSALIAPASATAVWCVARSSACDSITVSAWHASFSAANTPAASPKTGLTSSKTRETPAILSGSKSTCTSVSAAEASTSVPTWSGSCLEMSTTVRASRLSAASVSSATRRNSARRAPSNAFACSGTRPISSRSFSTFAVMFSRTCSCTSSAMSALATARRALLSPGSSMARRKPSTTPGSARTFRFAASSRRASRASASATRRGISGAHSWMRGAQRALRTSSVCHGCCSARASLERWLRPSDDTSVFTALPKISRARSASSASSSTRSFGSGWKSWLKMSIACTSSATSATAATCGWGCFMMSSSSLIMAPKRFLCSDTLVDCSFCFAAARSADPGAGLSWFVVWIPAAFALRLRRVSPPAEAPRCFSVLSISSARPSASRRARSVSESRALSFRLSVKRSGSSLGSPRAKPRARVHAARGTETRRDRRDGRDSSAARLEAASPRKEPPRARKSDAERVARSSHSRM